MSPRKNRNVKLTSWHPAEQTLGEDEDAENTTKLSRIMHSFARGTTMHGIPHAIRAHSMLGRIFWTVVCVLTLSLTCLEIALLLRKYYSYPKKVTIEVIPSAVPFPAISICNMRSLDVLILNKLNRIFKESNKTTHWVNKTDDPFVAAYMKTVAKYYPMFDLPESDISIFQTVLTRTTLATNLNRTILENAGVPFNEFIVTCRYAGKRCNRNRDFTHFFDPYYYNCFTFESMLQQHDRERNLAEGVENGMSTIVLTGSGMLDKNEELRMIPGTHEYSSPISSSEGVRVVIHPPNTEPYPHTEGFDIPPGYSASLGIQARENILIGKPHGNCSDKNPFGNDREKYRLISCQKKCLQKAVVKSCKCKDITLPDHQRYPDIQFCRSDKEIPQYCQHEINDYCFEMLNNVYNRILCAKNVSIGAARDTETNAACKCFSPCHQISYDVSYSLSKWPAESFDGEQAFIDIFQTEGYYMRFVNDSDSERLKLFAKHFVPSNRRNAMKNFARINAYIADSNVLKMVESPDYSQSQLLSDIGGQLGLWVGISVISVAEVLELFVTIVRYLIGARMLSTKWSRKPKTESNNHYCSQHCDVENPQEHNYHEKRNNGRCVDSCSSYIYYSTDEIDSNDGNEQFSQSCFNDSPVVFTDVLVGCDSIINANTNTSTRDLPNNLA